MGETYLKIVLTKRKAAKFTPQIGASPSKNDMKDEGLLNAVEPAEFFIREPKWYEYSEKSQEGLVRMGSLQDCVLKGFVVNTREMAKWQFVPLLIL